MFKLFMIGCLFLVMAEAASAGTSPGIINCSKGNASIQGEVPADDLNIIVLVRNGSKTVVLLDDDTAGSWTTAERSDIKGLPRILVDVGSDSKNPMEGRYFLTVSGLKNKETYLKIKGTPKKAEKIETSKGVEYTFKADLDFNIKELTASPINLKNVDCKWTYDNP